ncbi:transcription factor SPT20 homolog [Anastrepha ludens]|uniref:transcription factor SPT20 homolog n=1 Tax=Anastrepha ludens TaxID=28586 RepID=UPI0023B1C83A|nr:transcription factor SPT20 homolog [Anastrepha ludens]
MSQKSSARIKSKRRTGEPWVSNNRVLNSASITKKGCNSIGRNPNFDTDETKLLIQLWGDPKVQRTLIIAHKKHAVLCDLASKMQQYGYYRSPEEISTRIKNLKCFYNRLKKEIDTGLASAAEPTWKHYAEMDAIMKRPIFSVRPNEVPPPSLKYQLEKAREEREERRRKVIEEGGTLSDSDDGLDELVALSNGNASKNEIDDGIIPDVEVDINDEAFAAIASAAEKTVTTLSATKRRKVSKASEGSLELGSEYEDERAVENRSNGGTDMSDVQIKEENDSMDSDEFPLCRRIKRKSVDVEKTKAQKQSKVEMNKGKVVAIKEEPIDVDADEEIVKDVISAPKSFMPTLIDRLADSSGNIIIPVSSPITIVSTATCAPKATTITTSSAMTMAIVSPAPNMPKASPTTTSSTQSAPQGKISLVPTNFLMQPKPPTPTATGPTTPAPLIPLHQSQIQLLPNALNAAGALQPGRILLSGAAGVGGAQGTPTSAGFVATGPGGMKLLLVNADQAAAQMGASNTALGKTLLPQLNAALLQQQQQHQQQQQQKQQQQNQQQQQQLQKEQQQLQQQQQEQQAQQQQLQKEQQQLQQQQQQLKEAEEAKSQAASKRQQKQQHEKQRRDELLSRKEAANMRILLRHIYVAQTENNEIQQQRLALERERFDYERTAVERFFTELPKLFTQQQQQQQQQAQVLQQQQQQVAAAMQAHTQQMRLNPPKLVFTTAAVPGGTATLAGMAGMAGMAGGATILTPTKLTANAMPKLAPAPTAVITQASMPAAVTVTVPPEVPVDTQTGDVQLVTPKVEQDD